MQRTLRRWCMTGLVGFGLLWTPVAVTAGVTPRVKRPAATPTAKPAPKSTIDDNAPERSHSFDEWVAAMMQPRPYPKSAIIRIDKNFARPHKAVPWRFRIVKEDKDTVWLQPLPPEDPGSPLHEFWLQEQERQAVILHNLERPEKFNMLNFDEARPPLPFQDAVHFQVSQDGLPKSGQWRNNFVLADLNEDGIADMLMPPPREGEFRAPVILLGDGHGAFRQWKKVRWPAKLPFDYGGVAVADFDHDGHKDIVVAVHFKNQYVLYGDGHGDFSRFQKLPTPRGEVHSQAVAVADFNGDGWPDLAFLAEVSYDIKTSESLSVPSVWVLENGKGKGWTVHLKGLPGKVMGMKLVATDLDGDGRPDLLLSSNTQDWRNLVFFNKVDAATDAWNWATNRVGEVLTGAFHFSVVPEAGTTNQVLAVFQQFQLLRKPDEPTGRQSTSRSGLVRYTIHPNGAVDTRVLELDETEQRSNPWWRLASGDINGDGVADAVLLRRSGALQVLFGDGRGGYVEEKTPEFKPMGRPYDVQIRDVDGDGHGEIIVMTAATKKLHGGMGILRMAPSPPSDGSR